MVPKLVIPVTVVRVAHERIRCCDCRGTSLLILTFKAHISLVKNNLITKPEDKKKVSETLKAAQPLIETQTVAESSVSDQSSQTSTPKEGWLTDVFVRFFNKTAPQHGQQAQMMATRSPVKQMSLVILLSILLGYWMRRRS